VDPRVIRGRKDTGSGESHRNRFDQLALLRRGADQIVVCDRADYDWSRATLERLKLAARCACCFTEPRAAARC